MYSVFLNYKKILYSFSGSVEMFAELNDNFKKKV